MKKLYFTLLTISLFFFCLFISSTSAYASTEVYKVTDPFHITAPPLLGVNYVEFYTYLGINYQGGNVIISRNPDGTGTYDIGDIIQVADVQGEFTYSYPTSSNCVAHGSIQPTDITSYFHYHKPYTLLIRLLDACGQAKDISSIYMVIKNIPEPSPTPSPSLTPTPSFTPTSTPSPFPTATLFPTPTTIEPFLDLPWDYLKTGLRFSDAALAMTSYFDHTFPLLSVVPALDELTELKDQITTFNNERSSTKNYSSHDGYDFGLPANVHIGDPVLAAAGGSAMYINGCLACGNMIEIDHHNGYQTRYMHLEKEGLITDQVGKVVEVAAHQQIGQVGATGHVIPNDERGAHIHFGLVYDKNHDGNFSDNIPDGMTDPFGWQSSELDPWSLFHFVYAGLNKIGNVSTYLWKNSLDSLKQTITSSGYTLQNGNFTLLFPPGAVTYDTEIQLNSAPNVILSDKKSLGPKLIATAKTVTGNTVSTFQKAVTLTINFATYDLTPFQLRSLSIYSSNDGFIWEKQNTKIDMENKKATAQITHFTQFALMANLKDTRVPTTTAFVIGKKKVLLRSKDNHGGLGVDYILFNLDDTDWERYHAPINIEKNGNHVIHFYSVDKAGNIEETKEFNFTIDSTENNNSGAYHRDYKGS